MIHITYSCTSPALGPRLPASHRSFSSGDDDKQVRVKGPCQRRGPHPFAEAKYNQDAAGSRCPGAQKALRWGVIMPARCGRVPPGTVLKTEGRETRRSRPRILCLRHLFQTLGTLAARCSSEFRLLGAGKPRRTRHQQSASFAVVILRCVLSQLASGG